MKRNSLVLLAGVILLALCICLVVWLISGGAFHNVSMQPETTGPDQTPDITDQEPVYGTEEEIEFSAVFVRTDGYHDGMKYPVITVIRSTEELESYLDAYETMYDFSRKPDPLADQTPGMLDVTDRYDSRFFSEKSLVMVILEEGSGSVRHEVTGARLTYLDKNILTIDINRLVPEEGTDDMAEWHVLIEINKEMVPDESADIRVKLSTNGILGMSQFVAYDRGYGHVSFRLPDDWTYMIEDSEEDKQGFSIYINPPGHAGRDLHIDYMTMFGVCGTGLEEELITVGMYDAWKGTFDEKQYWNFIALNDTPPGYYVIFQDQPVSQKHAEDLDRILETISLEGAYISGREIMQIASKSVDAEGLDNPYAYFDFGREQWIVNFAGSGKILEVILDPMGNVLESSIQKPTRTTGGR